MKRRAFLRGSGALVTLGLSACKGRDPKTPADTDVDTDLSGSGDTGDTGIVWPDSDFNTPLPVPAELSWREVDGRKVFELEVQQGVTEFYPGQPTDTLGYNGALLGPTLRARRGDTVRIKVTNSLNEDTTTHWHGAHLPASADGGPHQIIAPGDTWVAEWTIDQHACTNWYHPHLMGTTAEQVYFGLAGLFLIDDDERDALDLPARYGVDDIPVVFQDRRFDADGQLEYNLRSRDLTFGFEGDTQLVNGVLDPYIYVEAKQVRLRLLNGSNGRVYRIHFDDDTPFKIIGVDNSLLEAPLEVTGVLMSPGERVEIVVDLSDRLDDSLRLSDRRSDTALLELRVALAPAQTTTLPDTLGVLEHLDRADAMRTRQFQLSMVMGGGFVINGVEMDLAVINEVVPVGEVELWQVTNASMMDHNFHMHGTHFEIHTRNGGPPGDHERGYKDTVYLQPGERVELLVKHTDYTDDAATYMYHCHFLEHEDQGMMGQFTVV